MHRWGFVPISLPGWPGAPVSPGHEKPNGLRGPSGRLWNPPRGPVRRPAGARGRLPTTTQGTAGWADHQSFAWLQVTSLRPPPNEPDSTKSSRTNSCLPRPRFPPPTTQIPEPLRRRGEDFLRLGPGSSEGSAEEPAGKQIDGQRVMRFVSWERIPPLIGYHPLDMDEARESERTGHGQPVRDVQARSFGVCPRSPAPVSRAGTSAQGLSLFGSAGTSVQGLSPFGFVPRGRARGVCPCWPSHSSEGGSGGLWGGLGWGRRVGSVPECWRSVGVCPWFLLG